MKMYKNKEYFQNQLEINQEKYKELEKGFNKISTLRLVVFLLMLVSFALGFGKSKILIVLGFVFLFAFLYLVRNHNKIKKQMEFYTCRSNVVNDYLARFSDQWRENPNDGEEYKSKDFTIGIDLDIFGKYSLYQYINCANTTRGENALASLLKGENRLSREDVKKRQEAVLEIGENTDLCLDLQAYGKLLGTKDEREEAEKGIEKFLATCDERIKLPGLFHVLAYALPIATFILLILGIMDKVSMGGFVILVFAQLFFAFGWSGKNLEVLTPLFALRNHLKEYSQIFAILEKTDFQSEELQKIGGLFKNASGTKAIFALSTIGELVNLRYSPVIYLPLAMFVMWDYHLVLALARWQKKYSCNLDELFDALAELEVIMSSAVIGMVKENATLPEITEINVANGERPHIAGNEMFYPLIDEDRVVANTFATNDGIIILTGSNMSGKTTFLRTLGMNLLLSYMGSMVCAKEFSASQMKLFTSMRVADDVSEGISTFYGEIRRIKSMVGYLPTRQPMLCLIDEIFKGTNTADRIIGATGVIDKLHQPWVIEIISTHDFELCDLEKDSKFNAKNYHFAENYVDDEIHFDYTIKDGRCKTANAKYLMKMAGIIE